MSIMAWFVPMESSFSTASVGVPLFWTHAKMLEPIHATRPTKGLTRSKTMKYNHQIETRIFLIMRMALFSSTLTLIMWALKQ